MFQKNPKLFASWPSSSPWVTAVGATRFQGQKVGKPEMATDKFGSGGGFSYTISRAQYQNVAVKHYLSIVRNTLPFPPAKSINFNGRANPDIAALGEGFQVIVQGRHSTIGGTSASTPLFAGLVSLLNEARLQRGLPPMGFLNPWIYSNTDAFTDIVEGTNAISRSGTPLTYGYNCTVGWDPVTGLGTPLFDKMLAAALMHE